MKLDMNNRHVSWEIILCGLLLTGLAIYINSSQSDTTKKRASSESAYVTPPEPPTPPESSTPPELSSDLNFEAELSKLEKELKKLENLGQLESLKALENLNIEKNNINKIVQGVMDEVAAEIGKINSEGMDVSDKTQLLALINSNVSTINNENEKQTWIQTGDGVYQYNVSFKSSQSGNLRVDMDAGHVNISSHDADSGLVQFVTTTSSASTTNPDKYWTVKKVSKENETIITLTNKSSFSSRSNHNIEANVLIPSGVSVKAQTAGGHVRVDDLEGNHTLHTSGGHISLTNVNGEFHTKTNGGHIEADGLQGRFELDTNGGNIQVKNLDGACQASTNGGHITFENLRGSVQAKTSGGNINVSVKSLSDDLSLQTSAGNISISLPESISALLDLKGTNVDLNEFRNKVDGTIKSDYVDGQLGEGGPKITARCSYGRVTLE